MTAWKCLGQKQITDCSSVGDFRSGTDVKSPCWFAAAQSKNWMVP